MASPKLRDRRRMTTARITPALVRELYDAGHAKEIARGLGLAWHTAREYVYEGVPLLHRWAMVRLIDKAMARLVEKQQRLAAYRKALIEDEAAAPPAVGGPGNPRLAVEEDDRLPLLAAREGLGPP